MINDRFVARKDGNGWRVVDVKTGILHSARIASRRRAVNQARIMSDRIHKIAGGR